MIKIVNEDSVKHSKTTNFNTFELTTTETVLLNAVKEMCLQLDNSGYPELYNCYKKNSTELLKEFSKTSKNVKPDMYKNGYWVNYCKKLSTGEYYLFHSEPIYDIIESTCCIPSKVDYGDAKSKIYYFGTKPDIPRTLKSFLHVKEKT